MASDFGPQRSKRGVNPFVYLKLEGPFHKVESDHDRARRHMELLIWQML